MQYLAREPVIPFEKITGSLRHIQTIYPAWGLQYRVGIVIWADEFEPRTGSDREHEERLLYIALTRESDILIVTYSSSNDFINRILKSGDAVESGKGRGTPAREVPDDRMYG